MNITVTSKEEILRICRQLVEKEGLRALNMREAARLCEVSVGSVYNYFPSKVDLTQAVVADIWKSIFHSDFCKRTDNFIDCVVWLFESIRSGAEKYPEFFTEHMLSFAKTDKGKARQTMENYYSHMKMGMLENLKADMAVKNERFTSELSKEEFVSFVFDNIISMLMKREQSCKVLTQIVKIIIY